MSKTLDHTPTQLLSCSLNRGSLSMLVNISSKEMEAHRKPYTPTFSHLGQTVLIAWYSPVQVMSVLVSLDTVSSASLYRQHQSM